MGAQSTGNPYTGLFAGLMAMAGAAHADLSDVISNQPSAMSSRISSSSSVSTFRTWTPAFTTAADRRGEPTHRPVTPKR